jgi:hypothetical protein
VNQDNIVVIEGHHDPDGPGIENRWARFTALFLIGPWSHPASYATNTRSFPGEKQPEHGVDHPPNLAPRLKKVYSYIYISPLDLHGKV